MIFPSQLNQRLSLHARHVLKEARDIAHYTHSPSIESRHLLLALALENGSLGSLLLENIGFKKEGLGKACLKKTRKGSSKKSTPKPLPLSSETQAIIKRAFFIASKHAYPYVGTEHLTSALLLSKDPFIQAILHDLDTTQEKVIALIEAHLHFDQFPQMARMFEMPDTTTELKEGDGTPLLDQYTVDLAEEAKKNPSPIIGREQELNRLMQILGRKEKRNALLIGEPGVGKTALVSALATRIQEGKVGPALRGKRVRGLDLALLVAGTSFRGEFENRLKELIKEIRHDGKTILFIDEIHTLVGTGNTQGGLDAANILKPALARGEFQCIGATTFGEYKRHLEKDSALERRFQILLLKEPTPEETKAILAAAAPYYTAHHQVAFPPSVLDIAVTLADRFIHERHFPDKALDLIDEAGALVHNRNECYSDPTPLHTLEQEVSLLERQKVALIEHAQYDEAMKTEKRLQVLKRSALEQVDKSSSFKTRKQSLPSVTHEDLLTVLTQITRIPRHQLDYLDPSNRLAAFTRAFSTLFVGQPEVHSAVLRVIARSLSPLRESQRPLGSFLLMGPTGVGKTYLAKVLAQAYFNDERALIRIDMSEFMERHSTAQLIGAPAGYIGYGDGGKLTEAVRRQPHSIILFDEIEKAHPDVAHLLLQILDEGHLTDAEGRKVSFENTLILLTANIGTESFTQAAKIGFSESLSKNFLHSFEQIKNSVLEELKHSMRPELIARIDETLVFQPLQESSLREIATKELATLQKRLLAQKIHLIIRPSVIHHAVTLALQENNGARALKKILRTAIEFPIIQKLAHSPRLKRLTLSVRHGSIILEK